MKLIGLLVKELPKSGGWPKDAVTAIYFSHNEGVSFYDESGMGIKNGVSFICMDIPGVQREEVTKEEFESALAASDGWIEWSGGECPVDAGVIVDLKDRDGYLWLGAEALLSTEAKANFWRHTGGRVRSSDIIAYRLHKPDIKSRSNDDRLERDLKEIEVSGKYLDDIMNMPVRIDRLERDLNECIGQDVDIPEWNGDGLPPVGTICQAKVPRSITGWEWRRVKVVESGIPGAEKEVLVYDLETTLPSWTDEFRPLRTEAENARDEAIKEMILYTSLDANSAKDCNHIANIYDAIAAGKIPGVKLEEK